MNRKRLIWQIFPPFLLIILIALIASSWLFSRILNDFHRDESRRGLEAQGQLIVNQVRPLLATGRTAPLDTLSKILGHKSGTRITIILPDGRVGGDSEESPQLMNNHANRPEVAVALSGSTGEATRYSQTLQQEMMYVALPVYQRGEIIGCVRTSLPISSIIQTLQKSISQIVYSGLLIGFAAALISLWLARRLSRPLEEMKQGAERFAKGELDRRLPAYRGEELGGLSDAMNQMAAQLSERIRTEVRQRNEQEAVLSSMIEGVLAIDNQEKILRLNQATADLLGIDPAKSIGRQVKGVIRKPDLQNFITQALTSPVSIEADMMLLHHGTERSLQAHGTPLCGADGQKFGALIVINDVTRLRRLENLRRDFVANVSHELKTPITAIKGAVETLQEYTDASDKDNLRFLAIAARQADRLNSIIDDLLALSRLERETETTGIDLSKERLLPILKSAVQACTTAAEARQVKISLSCPENLMIKANAQLFEQAVINLIDNAVKYSDTTGAVLIKGSKAAEKVIIEVSDRGHGIAQEHLPRLFERFYRVDAARSRAVGGTGLGLSIVKHIAQSHNGDVAVQSSTEGSIFTITLPKT
jgi:two-component system phosphate regulon sensor histidine kinase PhoR